MKCDECKYSHNNNCPIRQGGDCKDVEDCKYYMKVYYR